MSSEDGLELAAVVVTHRSDSVVPGLLRSLQQHEPDLELTIVDSGSPWGPPAVPDGVRCLALPENVGFGRACNAGVRSTAGRGTLVFLNPDVRLQGASFSQLRDALAARPDVGVATGPMVDHTGRRIPSAWGPTSPWRALWWASGLQASGLRKVVGRLGRWGALTSAATLVAEDVAVDGHVLGGAMVVRRECWEELGGFDEDYFLYWEDADLCYRARQLGWEVRVLPCTPIIHQAGTSSEGIDDDRRWRWYVQGAETFARKHLSRRGGRRLLAALRWGSKLRR